MEIKSRLKGDMIKGNKAYYEDLVTRFVWNSNAIKGNSLSYQNTYYAIFSNFSRFTKDTFEAIDLKNAFDFVLLDLSSDVSIDLIERIGLEVTRNTQPVSELSMIPSVLTEILYEYKESEHSVFERVAKLHNDFEHLHPFSDGNGGISRLIIARELMHEGVAPAVIPFERKSEYENALNESDVKALSGLLEELSAWERERMQKFGIKFSSMDEMSVS